MYRNVQVLLINWQEGHKKVRKQLVELGETFEKFYNYPTRELQIPSEEPGTFLDEEIDLFIKEYGKYQNLLIVYYGGHGDIDDDRNAKWKCEDTEDSPYVIWQPLQEKFLRDPKADTLFLLDCCKAASVIRSTKTPPSRISKQLFVEPIAEVVAATGFTASTPLFGEHTFTANLILELRLPEHWDRKPDGTNVRFINSGLINRLKRFHPNDGKERRQTSNHFWILDYPHSTKNITLGRLIKQPDPEPNIPIPPVFPQISKEDLEKDIRIQRLRVAQRENRSSVTYQQSTPTDEIEDDEMGSAQEERSFRTENWMRLMNEFLQTSMVLRGRRDSPRVKVAVLNTGIDLDHPFTEIANIGDCKDFVDESNVDDDMKVPDYIGSGTHQVSILSEMAPEAELYVGRITKGRYFTSEGIGHIARAIDWAATKARVDIIVLPFGFPKRDRDLQAAVDRACSQDVICIAATSNSGGNATVSYPANSRRVIAINSTDGLGNPSPFNPSPREDDMNFATLGELVKGAWPTAMGQGATQLKTGTSFAVCVAAAILANVLEYARVNLRLSGDLQRTLRSFEGAHAMLKLMSAKRGGYSYVAPWLLWSDDQSGEEVDARIVAALKRI